VQFTASAALHEKLARLRALMRSQVPDGDLGSIIEAAITEKLGRLEARRFAATSRPRKHLATTDASPSSRRIPAAVRRAVRERDGGRCRYVDASGRRCNEQHGLEYHHIHPFGFGGDHRPENLRLVCRAHNAHMAESDYGREAIARFRRSGRPGRRPASRAVPLLQGAVAVASARATGGPVHDAPRGS
jgi:5-methylcytosine-specific restriction endonuclease McrA